MTDRRSDADLARGVGSRDQGSLKEIYETYGGPVFGLALRVLRNRQLAEDVVQETFVGFWNSPGGYDSSRGSLKTYLLTIAHRRAVDIVRSEEERTRREAIPPDRAHGAVEDEVLARVSAEGVRRAVAELEENEREAIAMAYFGGLTYVEVAEYLGAPEGTVKSRIRSGMKKRAANLEGLEP